MVGDDPVNNIIRYIIILYIIYTYTAYGFPICTASSRSASASDAVWVSRQHQMECNVCIGWNIYSISISIIYAFDVMTTPLTMRVIQMHQLFHPSPKIGSSDPLHILHRVSYGWPQNAQILAKIWRLVSEKFSETKNIFSGPPFTGGPDAKILFLSTQRPPTAQKISSPPDLPFWRYGSQSFNFPTPSPEIGSSDPLHILHRVSYRWPPKTLEFSWKSDEWFLRNLLKPNVFFQSSALQGVRMLRFWFWVLKGPQLHKKIRVPGPPILEI